MRTSIESTSKLSRRRVARTRPRVVVTGLGAVTPLGADVQTTWRRALAGRSGVGRIRGFDPTGFDTRIAAEVHPYRARTRWRPARGGRLHRKQLFALDALEEALASARLSIGEGEPERAAVVFGGEVSQPTTAEIGRAIARGEGNPISPRRSASHLTASLAAERIGATGPIVNVSLACASSAAAVAQAMDLIRAGVIELAIAGGSDSQIHPINISYFSLLQVLSRRNRAPRRASRPFDVDRDGFVMGEGAGVLVLESLEHARRRGAPILAELAGYGVSANAYRITDSPPDGRGPAEAMEAALADGCIRPGEIDYVNAHGTATVDNDVSESRAIQRVLGRRTAVSSTKSMIGHLIAAAGAVELILTILSVRDSAVPPTINLDAPDPHCALDHVALRARRMPVRKALTNSFGFGGTNVSLAVSAGLA